jgi:cell division septum initiation protein DivIVA
MDQKFNIVRKGYAQGEVDQYIFQLEQLIEERNKELAQYKDKENAITASLVEAQAMAASIKEKANQEAEQKKQETEKEIEAMRQNAQLEMSDITAKVAAFRKKLDDFKSSYNTILDQYLVQARATDMTALFNELDDYMDRLGMKPKHDDEPVALENIGLSDPSREDD